MKRMGPVLGVAAMAIMVQGQALAADWDDFGAPLRGTMGDDWGFASEPDPLGFEAGIRYWYSMGATQHSVEGVASNSTDTTHILEGHLRIDDFSTSTYVKAIGGYSVAINGTYENALGTGPIVDGQVGYVGADFGFTPWGDPANGVALGGLVGYQYWNDSPDAGRFSFITTETAEDIGFNENTGDWWVGGDSEQNSIDIHALRLGLSGRVNIGTQMDITAEAAAIPYAWVNGTLGSHGVATIEGGTYTSFQSSPTTINGFGYGAMGELMVGFHPTENVTLRLGGRAWYLQGTYDATYDRGTVFHPTDSDPDEPPNFDTPPDYAEQTYISTDNPFSLFRYGALAELTIAF